MRHAKGAEESPLWTAGEWYPGSAVAFVCGCLFVRGNADSFIVPLCPSFPARRASPTLPFCSLDEEPTESSVCRGRAGGGRGGKVRKGNEKLGDADWWTADGGFRGPCLRVFIRDLVQIFPLFQSSLEIPWPPSLPPRHRHTLSVTPLSHPRPRPCTLLYPAK